MWELAHGLEWVAAIGLVATLVAPHVTDQHGWRALLFVALTFAIVLMLSFIAAASARLAIDTSVRFYWPLYLRLRSIGHCRRVLDRDSHMKIMFMLWKNLFGRAVTACAFPRRLLRHIPVIAAWSNSMRRSVPAAPCVHFAAPRAPSTFVERKGDFKWSYDPGQCTFCGTLCGWL